MKSTKEVIMDAAKMAVRELIRTESELLDEGILPAYLYYVGNVRLAEYNDNVMQEYIDGVSDEFYGFILDDYINQYPTNIKDAVVSYYIHTKNPIFDEYQYTLKDMDLSSAFLKEYFSDEDDAATAFKTVLGDEIFKNVMRLFVGETYNLAADYLVDHPEFDNTNYG